MEEIRKIIVLNGRVFNFTSIEKSLKKQIEREEQKFISNELYARYYAYDYTVSAKERNEIVDSLSIEGEVSATLATSEVKLVNLLELAIGTKNEEVVKFVWEKVKDIKDIDDKIGWNIKDFIYKAENTGNREISNFVLQIIKDKGINLIDITPATNRRRFARRFVPNNIRGARRAGDILVGAS